MKFAMLLRERLNSCTWRFQADVRDSHNGIWTTTGISVRASEEHGVKPHQQQRPGGTGTAKATYVVSDSGEDCSDTRF